MVTTYQFFARCLTGAMFLTMLAVPTERALSLPVCSGTPVSFQPTVGGQNDPAQPFTTTVPPGMSLVTIDAGGAQGGFGQGHLGAFGAEVITTVPIAQGQVLCVVAGTRGQDGISAGGGGGASFVFKGNNPCTLSQLSLSSLLVVAGGGGAGGGSEDGAPGRGTGLGAGVAGALAGGSADNGGGAGGTGGNGGGGSAGGGGGGLLTDGGNGISSCTGGKALVNGATGGNGCLGQVGNGGFGGGGSGGGGGYNGGGGTKDGVHNSGGGGSFSAFTPTFAQDGGHQGDGAVSLCYGMSPDVPTLSPLGLILLCAGLIAISLLASRRRARLT